ncbi:hypothetical protein CSAL01_05065 [Colletotrichum salicis]|uniref:Uncharacterized protein n=1 Tax=Colletotrichum salicis TaxID=1209931 RepID=A0A135U4W2_9PEZI|nr:hypothetical protein CSAL01_05065 [Colletotrichum salicis]
MEIGLVTTPRLEANLMFLAISPTLDPRNLDREPSVHFLSLFWDLLKMANTMGTVSAFWHLALAPLVPKVLPHSRRADFLESRRLAHAAVG